MSKASNGADLDDDLDGEEDDESLPGEEDTIILSEESLRDQESDTSDTAIRIASSTGTPLPARMLSVRVKRAVLTPRTRRPTTGIRSRKL